MAVWHIRSLHFSRTMARYLLWSMAYGVVWEHVYGMLRKLASPESRAFTTYTGGDRPSMVRPGTSLTTSGTGTSVDHPHLRTSCSLATDCCIDCLVQWMVNPCTRPDMSLACWVGPPAYLVGGY